VTERRWLRSFVLLAVSALFTVLLPGCGGCNSNSKTKTAAQKKKEEEEKKAKEKKDKKKKKSDKPVEDFTFGRVLVQPSEIKKGSPDINYVKRGHWVAATQQMRANNFDAQAEMKSLVADSSGIPFDIEHTNYSLLFSRPVSLAKGSVKPVESVFFVPRERVESRPPNLRNELLPQRGGFQIHPESTPVSAMEEWQYLFLVLSSRTSNFGIIDKLGTVEPPYDNDINYDGSSDPPIQYYRVLKPVIDKRVPLPANPLAWTSIAVILWDDIDPAKLDGPQQQAMLDWLHWGGHLLISGPNSLDRLKGTFLEPYLPASNKQTVNLTQSSFDELNRHWSLKIKARPQVDRDLKLVKDIVGIELELAPHGEFLPHTGQLVAAGRVGQGRIVVTGFSLASGAFQTWKNVDGFFNGALLLRPGRHFKAIQLNDAGNFQAIAGFQTTWSDSALEKFRRDSRLVSNMRYFSRDMGFAPGDEKVDTQYGLHPYFDLTINKVDTSFGAVGPDLKSSALESGKLDDDRFGGYLAVPRAGVASWNDFSGSAIAARKHLTDAAGVKIPTADFVAKLLAIYLLVLVPVNWGIFRAMRRVEWAWIAAPIIAIIGAFTVVKLAQLDIGFVRSRTEIDVVELQEGYSRAHVTRFIALYTSLATGYDMKFEDPTALVQPLALKATYTRPPLSSATPVHFRQDTDLRLSGFKVDSNSTGQIHAEQMHDAGGAVELLGDEATGFRLKNGTSMALRDAGVIRRSESGGRFVCYVAEIKPGTTVQLKFRQLKDKPKEIPGKDKVDEPYDKTNWLEEWDDTSIFARVNEESKVTGEVRLGRFAQLASEQLQLQPGGARLIAWSPQAVEGVAYLPDAPQVNGISFVLAHLKRGPLPEPERDQNVLQDVKANAEPLKALDATDPNANKPDEDNSSQE